MHAIEPLSTLGIGHVSDAASVEHVEVGRSGLGHDVESGLGQLPRYGVRLGLVQLAAVSCNCCTRPIYRSVINGDEIRLAVSMLHFHSLRHSEQCVPEALPDEPTLSSIG